MTNKEFFLQCWQDEAQTTVKAIKALPADITKWEYRPNAKARTAMQILGHIAPHGEALANSVATGVVTEEDRDFNSVEEAAAYYEKSAEQVVQKLASVDEKTWNEKVIPMVYGGQKIFEAPMFQMFWSFLFDTIHHRGQLSTYYRAMGVRNPQIYGPTAEDIEEMMAAHKN